jgi:hypothetical protein
MKYPTAVATVVLAAVTAAGCDASRLTAPTPTTQLLAAPTTTPAAASAPLTVADPGTTRSSGDTVHVRDLVLVGPVSGDITGTIMTVANLNGVPTTGTGTASGTFTISGAAGDWEGNFHGQFDAGVFSGRLAAKGTGAYDGQTLRGSLAQVPGTNVVQLTGTIRQRS